MVLVLLRRPGTKVNSSISRADINIIAIEMQQFCGVALAQLRWPTLISVAQRSAHCRHSAL